MFLSDPFFTRGTYTPFYELGSERRGRSTLDGKTEWSFRSDQISRLSVDDSWIMYGP